MTILITGGTGRTATRLAKIIADHNVPVLLTSRKGPSAVPQPFKGVAFDWLDPSTFENPFKADHSIDRVYLVAAPSINMRPFVDFAIAKGVKRFVLLSAILVEKGGIAHGKLHQFLEEESGLEWCVLRPSTFFQSWPAAVIKENGSFSTATGDGKIGFVAADDIAEQAARALLDEKSHNTEHLLVGPQLISYSEGAQILSEVLDKKIIHSSVPADEREPMLMKEMGVPLPLAKVIAGVELAIAAGQDSKHYTSPKAVVGKRNIRDFFEENKAMFLA